jgi:hypothetical protein
VPQIALTSRVRRLRRPVPELDVRENVGTAIAIAVSASGLVRTRTTPLLSIEETDRALSWSVEYKPPHG